MSRMVAEMWSFDRNSKFLLQQGRPRGYPRPSSELFVSVDLAQRADLLKLRCKSY